MNDRPFGRDWGRRAFDLPQDIEILPVDDEELRVAVPKHAVQFPGGEARVDRNHDGPEPGQRHPGDGKSGNARQHDGDVPALLHAERRERRRAAACHIGEFAIGQRGPVVDGYPEAPSSVTRLGLIEQRSQIGKQRFSLDRLLPRGEFLQHVLSGLDRHRDRSAVMTKVGKG